MRADYTIMSFWQRGDISTTFVFDLIILCCISNKIAWCQPNACLYVYLFRNNKTLKTCYQKMLLFAADPWIKFRFRFRSDNSIHLTVTLPAVRLDWPCFYVSRSQLSRVRLITANTSFDISACQENNPNSWKGRWEIIRNCLIHSYVIFFLSRPTLWL